MPRFNGTTSRRYRAKWHWNDETAPARKAIDRCNMQTSTNRFCAASYLHRGGHSTRLEHDGIKDTRWTRYTTRVG